MLMIDYVKTLADKPFEMGKNDCWQIVRGWLMLTDRGYVARKIDDLLGDDYASNAWRVRKVLHPETLVSIFDLSLIRTKEDLCIYKLPTGWVGALVFPNGHITAYVNDQLCTGEVVGCRAYYLTPKQEPTPWRPQ